MPGPFNDDGITCPSGVDPGRHPHRKADGWTLPTVAAILANPRYTGRQVWNRQRTDRESLNAAIGGRVDREVMRWNQAQAWVISTRMAHPGLVSEADFIAAQAIRAARPTGDGTTYRYLLAGLLVCRHCGRRMDAHWVNDRPGYRCRHGRTSAKPPATGHHGTFYRREDRILPELAAKLGLHAAGNGADEMVQYLRANHFTIICGDVGCTLISDKAPDIGPTQGQQTLW